MDNNIMDATPLTKIFDAAVLLVAFAFNALVLDAEWQSLAIAVGGSFSGSIILAYFRRDVRKVEQAFKVIASAIGGLVLGTVLQKYLHIESEEYRLGLFFVSSMLALVVLRSLLSLTENNVADMLRAVLQRVFNLKVETEKVKREVRRNREHIEKLEKDKDN